MARTLTDAGGLDPPKVDCPRGSQGSGGGGSGQSEPWNPLQAGAPVQTSQRHELGRVVSRERGRVRSATEGGRAPWRQHPADVPLLSPTDTPRLTQAAARGRGRGSLGPQPTQGVLGAPDAVAGVLRGRPRSGWAPGQRLHAMGVRETHPKPPPLHGTHPSTHEPTGMEAPGKVAPARLEVGLAVGRPQGPSEQCPGEGEGQGPRAALGEAPRTPGSGGCPSPAEV